MDNIEGEDEQDGDDELESQDGENGNKKERERKSAREGRHFCIFDELFSGTNPEEAISSSYGFIKYLINTKRIDFALTTHLSSLCDMMNKEKVIEIKNVMMETYAYDQRIEEEEEEDEEDTKEKKEEICDQDQDFCDFTYTYKLVDGVSKVKGGIKVLKDLKYPSSILRLF